ncbi:MAG: O-antigen ligase family protein [Gemmataceae bacterium]
MKWQFLFLCSMTIFGWIGSLFFNPFIGLWTYYLFTVLRPQFLWEYALQNYFIGHWAFYVSMPLIATFCLWNLGLLSYGKREIENRFRPKLMAGHWLMLLFGFWISLSFFFSRNQTVSNDWYGEYIKIIVVFFIAGRVIRKPEHIKAILIMIAVVLAYIAGEVFQEYAFKNYLMLYKRGFAGLDNNGAALMIAMGIPVCYFCWEMIRHWSRHFFLIAIPFLMYAVLTSYSRGAMLSTLVGAPFLFLYTKHKKMMALFYVCGAIFITVAAGHEIQDRFFTVSKADQDASFMSRWTTWNIAINMANNHPFFGVGIRCSNLYTQDYGADMYGRTIHSQYLQIAAVSGYPALAIYLILFFYSIFACWRARRVLWYRTDEVARQACCMLGAIEISLIVFFVGASALSLEVFELPYIMMLLGIQMLALLHATDTMAPSSVPRVISLRVNPSAPPPPVRESHATGPGWVRQGAPAGAGPQR